MLKTILTQIWTVATTDEIMQSLWECPNNPNAPTAADSFVLGKAADDQPMPYVSYHISDAGRTGDIWRGSPWPMMALRLYFDVYGYSTNQDQIIEIVSRLLELFSMRGYDGSAKANCARTYEPIGPTTIETLSKNVVGYNLDFPLRVFDIGALNAKTIGPR